MVITTKFEFDQLVMYRGIPCRVVAIHYRMLSDGPGVIYAVKEIDEKDLIGCCSWAFAREEDLSEPKYEEPELSDMPDMPEMAVSWKGE